MEAARKADLLMANFKSPGAAAARGMYARLLDIANQRREAATLDGIEADRMRQRAMQDAALQRQAQLDAIAAEDRQRNIANDDRTYQDAQARQAILDQRYEDQQTQAALDRADAQGQRYLDTERRLYEQEKAADRAEAEAARQRAHAMAIVNRQMAGQANDAPTQSQRVADSFVERAVNAAEVLDDVEDHISRFNRYVPNFLLSEDGQAYQQSKRQFIEAYLRKDSGAAISESEYANADRTYFVQPGDSAATVRRKQRARTQILDSLRLQGSGGNTSAGSNSTSTNSGGNRPAVFGELRTINGVPARWDGHGWLPVGQ